jgi:hypothetical protein
MSSKLLTKFSNLILSRNNLAKRTSIRFNTTGTPPTPEQPVKPPPAAVPPVVKPPTPAAPAQPIKPPTQGSGGGPKPSGKGKGPVTWKSLGFLAVGGAGVLVCLLASCYDSSNEAMFLILGIHVVCER